MEESETQADLQVQVWQLQGVEYGNDDTVTPSDPSQYTLEFGEEGVVLLRADCNYGSGTYEQDGSQLTIEPVLLTRALCPPDSYSDDYLRDLGFVRSYVLEDGDLFLSLLADGGILHFSPLSLELTGPGWALTEMITADYQISFSQPGGYTLSFDTQGGVEVQADCNRSMGSYTQTDQNLSIELGPTSLAACPPISLADPYIQSLSAIASYSLDPNQLQIISEAGVTLVFQTLDSDPESDSP